VEGQRRACGCARPVALSGSLSASERHPQAQGGQKGRGGSPEGARRQVSSDLRGGRKWPILGVSKGGAALFACALPLGSASRLKDVISIHARAGWSLDCHLLCPPLCRDLLLGFDL